MKRATGIVRRVDPLGRIVIPNEIRKVLEISHNTPLSIYLNADNEIVLEKYISPSPTCVFCGVEEIFNPLEPVKLIAYKGKKICPKCLKEMKGL